MPLPRFVQRLFQNDGYGPKLRHDIIPWDEEKSLVALEAWRQAMIGTPMPMAGTTLPPGFLWADGSFAAFAAYPELKAKYEAGGFAGLLLAYDASEEDVAAYPGKFKPDAANPTGLFVPRLTGLFARYCGQGEQAGAYHRDEIRNIRARLEPSIHLSAQLPILVSGGEATLVNMEPVFKAYPMCYSDNVAASGYACGIDASLSVPTGPENVPQHYIQSVALYLGRATQV